MNMANMYGVGERKNSTHLRFEEHVPPSGWTEDSGSYCLIIDLPGFKREQVKLQVDENGRIVASGERHVNEYRGIRFQQSYKVPENSNIEDTSAKFEDEILYVVIPKNVKGEKEPKQESTNIPEAAEEEKKTKHKAADKVPEPLVQEEKDKDEDRKSDAAADDGHEQESHSHRHRDEETSEEEDYDDNEEAEEEETEEEFQDAKMEEQKNEVTLMGELVKQLKKNKGFLIAAVFAFSLGVLVSQKFQPNEKYESSSTS